MHSLLPLPEQFATLFIRAVRVRRFETLSRQDFLQFVTVGLVCGMIWCAVGVARRFGCSQMLAGLHRQRGDGLCSNGAA